MTTKKQKKISSYEFVKEVFCGAAVAITYTDEEIYANLPKEEADEFIQARKEYMRLNDPDYRETENDNSGSSIPLAAEENAEYN